MNGRKEAIAQLKEFLLSDKTCLLLTGAINTKNINLL